jgi:hypothetical protein
MEKPSFLLVLCLAVYYNVSLWWLPRGELRSTLFTAVYLTDYPGPCMLDILLQLGYLGLLSHYVLHIATSPNSFGAREVLLMIYSTTSLLNSPTFLFAPFFLVAGAFLFSFPETPFPGDTSYSFFSLESLAPISSSYSAVGHPSNSPECSIPASFSTRQRPCLPILLWFPHFPTVFMLAQPPPTEIQIAFSALWCILVFLMISSQCYSCCLVHLCSPFRLK